jgi:NAD(P)-dependent dehydrogenase (short-subunit alcohol dehydrogenase family)
MSQRVLITAGASGIGKEIASAYAAIGAQVCVCDINEKALESAARDVPGRLSATSQNATTSNAWSPLLPKPWADSMCWSTTPGSQGRRHPSRNPIPTNEKPS